MGRLPPPRSPRRSEITIGIGVLGAAGALIAHKMSNKSKRMAFTGHRNTPVPALSIPATARQEVVPQQQQRHDGDAHTLNEQPQQQQQQQPMLAPAESIKLSAMPVLCLEVEAASEETGPAAAADAAKAPGGSASSTAMLRMQDLLVALAVLLMCVVVDRLTSDAVTVMVLLAIGTAVFVGASLNEHFGQVLRALTGSSIADSQLRQGGQQQVVMAAGGDLGTVMAQLKAASRTALRRLDAEATAAAIGVAFLIAGALESCNSLLSAASHYLPWRVCDRFLTCIQAVAHIGVGSDSDDTATEKKQQEQQSVGDAPRPGSKQPVWPPPAEDSEEEEEEVTAGSRQQQPFAALRAVKGYVDCLQAIAELGDGAGTLSEWLQEQPATQSAPAAATQVVGASSKSSGGGAWLQACSPLTVADRISSCLEAITALGEGADGEDSEWSELQQAPQQQQPVLKAKGAAAASSSSSSAGNLMHCMQAVAQIGGVEAAE